MLTGMVNAVRALLGLFFGTPRNHGRAGAAAAGMAAPPIDATAAGGAAKPARHRAPPAFAAAPAGAGTADDTGVADRGPANTAPADTGPADTALGDTAPGHTGAGGHRAATGAAAATRAVTPGERKAMSSGFDMHAEIAQLAERIIEPVAGRLTAQQLQEVVAVTREVFEQLEAGSAVPEPGLGPVASGIIEPVRANLTETEYRRAVDRLAGAMTAFCQGQRAA
ncbi:MAG: hypothetical protein FWD12_11870 [Alphaproteobacteria bacterium]|nr:hypothetical protein [Alphaproteobacteria bacterium]